MRPSRCVSFGQAQDWNTQARNPKIHATTLIRDRALESRTRGNIVRREHQDLTIAWGRPGCQLLNSRRSPKTQICSMAPGRCLRQTDDGCKLQPSPSRSYGGCVHLTDLWTERFVWRISSPGRMTVRIQLENSLTLGRKENTPPPVTFPREPNTTFWRHSYPCIRTVAVSGSLWCR